MDDSLIQARIDLAAAFRLAARFDLNEGICNHFSYAPPERPGAFLVNPFGTHLVAADGQRPAAGRLTKERSWKATASSRSPAFCIHSRIHRDHPRATCVLHTHMPYATTLTSLEETPLEPISQNALRYYNDVAYDGDYNGIATEMEEGARMAKALVRSGCCSSPITALSWSAPTSPRPSRISTTWSAPVSFRCWHIRRGGRCAE